MSLASLRLRRAPQQREKPTKRSRCTPSFSLTGRGDPEHVAWPRWSTGAPCACRPPCPSLPPRQAPGRRASCSQASA